MPDKWVTVAEAAAGLKVHPRTVERQVKSGKLQSRRTDAGQLEVYVNLPDTATPGERALSVVAGQAENQVQLALGATSALVKSAQEDARLARMDAEKAWQEAGIARRGAMIAWISVGTMAAGVMVAIGWTSSTLTRTQVELSHSSEKVRQMSDTANTLAAERDALRSQLAEANEKRATAEGQLSGRAAADQSNLAQAIQKLAERPAPVPPAPVDASQSQSSSATPVSPSGSGKPQVGAVAPTTAPSVAQASSARPTSTGTRRTVSNKTPGAQTQPNRLDSIANTSPGISPDSDDDR